MAIRFMAPAHGLSSAADCADSFFDEDIAEVGPGMAPAPSAHSWGNATPAAQNVPVQPGSQSGGRAPHGPPEVAQLGLDWLSARHASDAVGSQPSGASLAQQPQQDAAAGMQSLRTTQVDGSAVILAVGTTAYSMAAEPASRSWLPAPGSDTEPLRGPPGPLRVALATQPWATTAALPIDPRREALSSVSDEVSSLHSDAAGTAGQRPPALQPMSIGFLGADAAADDAAAFEFASLTPGDEPGSPLAVGSWSADRGSSLMDSFRLPASSMVAGSAVTGNPIAAAQTVVHGLVEALEVDVQGSEPQLVSSPPASLPTASLLQANGAALQLSSKPGVSAVSSDGGAAQPTGPPSPRPPRSPVRTQDGGPLTSAARAGIAKFRGWQSGKRSAADTTAAQSAQDGTAGRKDRLPPAHSTSLDRWLPPPASEPLQGSSDAIIAAGPGVQQIATGTSMPSATAGTPPPDLPVAVWPHGPPSLASLQHGQLLPSAVPGSSTADGGAQGGYLDGQPSGPTDPVVGGSFHGKADSTAAPEQRTADASEGRHDLSLDSQRSAQGTLAKQLAHSKADVEASREQLRQRDGELAAMVELQGVREAEVAALRRQLEDVHQGAA